MPWAERACYHYVAENLLKGPRGLPELRSNGYASDILRERLQTEPSRERAGEMVLIWGNRWCGCF